MHKSEIKLKIDGDGSQIVDIKHISDKHISDKHISDMDEWVAH